MLRSRSKSLLLAGRPSRGLLSDGFRGPRAGKIAQGGGLTASSRAVNLIAGTPAHTKGSWIEIEDSVPFDVDGFYVNINFTSARQRHFIDIGIGGSGSEVVLVPDIPITGSASGHVHGIFYIPMRVPAGSRVSGRNQCLTALSGADTQLIFVASEAQAAASFTRCTAYGHTHASTISVCAPDPDNTANTKGAYDELVASTTNPMKAWSFFSTSQSQDFASNRTTLVDLAVGAAASEVVLLGDMYYQQHSVSDHIDPPCIGPIYVPIRAGVRLSARAQSSASSDGPFTYCYVLGFD